MNDIKKMYFQYLLFSRDTNLSSNCTKSTFPRMEVSRDLLEFLSDWKSIESITIDGLLWKNYDVTLIISNAYQEVSIHFLSERTRDFTLEQSLVNLIKQIFMDYYVTFSFEWLNDWEY